MAQQEKQGRRGFISEKLQLSDNKAGSSRLQLVCAYGSISKDHVQAGYYCHYYFFGRHTHLALALLLSAENELSHVSSFLP